ncbi:MAG: hypothetical protein A2901_01820 [Elusimicrobia bacterium RIFCSPLOWO2_01_FULL_54_10]|nr:MAG: hypothetical protein A2901_01820 [Elusimicrobia bacterium RIFCSPLOWO2_01_FULL_54_10]
MSFKSKVHETAETAGRLKEFKSNFNSIVNNNKEGILVVDMKGIIRFANPAMKILLNRKDQKDLHGRMFGHPLTTGNKVELEIIRRNQRPGIGEMHVEMTLWKGKSAYLIMLFDVTERKASELALREANKTLESRVEERTKEIQLYSKVLEKSNASLAASNRELEEFAYVAAHDLQEPLRMINMYLGLLSSEYQGKWGKQADEFIGYAKEGAQRCQRLIKELLGYARISTRGGTFKSSNLNIVFEKALLNLRLAIQESGAQITAQMLPTISVDAVQMTQLLQNLIQNSIKYRKKAKPVIQVSAKEDHENWIFCIKDNGMGIEPEFKDKIFGIFQRLQTRNATEGTGIGLAYCKKIVERHGGRIWMESDGADKGTKFYFTIPTLKH